MYVAVGSLLLCKLEELVSRITGIELGDGLVVIWRLCVMVACALREGLWDEMLNGVSVRVEIGGIVVDELRKEIVM